MIVFSCSGRQCHDAGQCAPRHIEVGVRDVEVHGDYEECERRGRRCVTMPKYDVALLTLNADVSMTDYIQPACLPPLRTMISYTNMVVTGWGNTASGFSYKPADILQKLHLKEGDNKALCFQFIMLL